MVFNLPSCLFSLASALLCTSHLASLAFFESRNIGHVYKMPLSECDAIVLIKHFLYRFIVPFFLIFFIYPVRALRSRVSLLSSLLSLSTVSFHYSLYVSPLLCRPSCSFPISAVLSSFFSSIFFTTLRDLLIMLLFRSCYSTTPRLFAPIPL